jgi:hypothetical protein
MQRNISEKGENFMNENQNNRRCQVCGEEVMISTDGFIACPTSQWHPMLEKEEDGQ